jgi:hypothetical protein
MRASCGACKEARRAVEVRQHQRGEGALVQAGRMIRRKCERGIETFYCTRHVVAPEMLSADGVKRFSLR